MQKLLDIVVEQLLEAQTGVLDTVHELHGFLPQQLEALLEADNILRASWIDRLADVKNFDRTSWHLGVKLAKFVTGPFNAVKCLFWEHLKRAMRNLIIVLRIVH